MNVDVKEFSGKVFANLEQVIVGKPDTINLLINGLLSQGHILIEDVPGVGKTMLARALARTMGCSFKRLQFTPDLLPSDVTGVSIFNQVTREFEFRPGPVMAQIVLADEINRATPKTQSALLEAMEERQVTVDGVTYPLEPPFMVIGTQNPIEYEGTFPLPEAQLDRFMLRISLGYPSLTDEIRVLEDQHLRHPINTIDAVTDASEVVAAQESIKSVFVSDAVKRYIVDIIRATREQSDIYLGASPRGSLSLYRTGQAKAAMEGRTFVLPDDVKYLAEFVLGHRIMIDPAARIRDISSKSLITELLRTLPVPGGDFSLRDNAGQ